MFSNDKKQKKKAGVFTSPESQFYLLPPSPRPSWVLSGWAPVQTSPAAGRKGRFDCRRETQTR